MAVQIQLRRGTATQWANTSTGNPILAVGEMALETDTNLFKVGDGYRHWNDLPYGGIRGPQGNTGTVGPSGPTIAVQNVLYVSKSGNDTNDGTTLGTSKLTIKAALAIATRGTTVFVKSGDYLEANPMTVPDFVSIIGDNLRSVTVRPQYLTQDIFYVNNGTYIAHMTFKEHVSPSAAIAFPADGSAGVISTSPYVQNCTSMTTTGTGMRVDGDLALGTKSMMVDAFTQYNQGGIGIHLLNSGYASLVSVFTICCDKGFWCETGGFCSITNSNSSFGNYALYADGVGAVRYQGRVVGTSVGKVFTITNLTSVPSVGDAVGFGNGNYYTVASAEALSIGSTVITYPSISQENADLRNARQTVLSELSTLQVATIEYIKKTYPGFDFNQFKCSRDVGTILKSICYDMVLYSNYQTVLAGNSYYRAGSSPVIDSQFTQTLAAINFLKTSTLALISYPSTAWTRVNGLFNVLIDRFTNGGTNPSPAYEFSPPTGANINVVNAVGVLQANKLFLEEETTSYINNFTYNTTSCHRDTGLIVDSIAFDLLYGGFSQGTFAGLQYWSQDLGYIGDIPNQIVTLTNAISFVQVQAVELLTGISLVAASTVSTLFDTVNDIIINGPVGVTDRITANSYESTDLDIVFAYNELINNQNAIAEATIQYLNTTTTIVYDKDICYRDVTYIIQSVAFDLLHGGNRQSIMSGVYYYGYDGNATVIIDEIPQTVAAYKFINKLSKNLVLGVASPIYQRAIMPVINTGTATSVQTMMIDNIVSTITNIISKGPSVVKAKTPIPLVASTITQTINSFKLLLDNRAFIQAETIGYINNKFKLRTYNTNTCFRDTGLIVDSIAMDLAYGGTSQSTFAGLQYWSQNQGYTGDVGGEITTITNSINYVRDLAVALIANNAAKAFVSDRFDQINSIIASGTVGITDTIIPNGLASTSSNIVNSYNALISNQYNIASQTVDWINLNNPTFVYNTSTCYRDVTYMVQSVAFDLLHGGNRQTVMSGVYYYRYNSTATVIANQIPQTVAAYDFIKDISQKIILGTKIAYPWQTAVMQTTGTNTATQVEVSLIDTVVSTITNIIYNGPSVAGPKVPIDQTFTSTQSTINAYDLLSRNRYFIQMETIAYINNTFGNLAYSAEICKRDVGYIVDAITYDLMYSGNSQTSVAADAYYDGSTLQISSTEQPATAAAYYFLASLLPKIITNTAVTPNQIAVSQNVSLPSGTAPEGATARTLMRIVAQVVDEAYTSVVTLIESVPIFIGNDTTVTFQNFSQIQSSAHNFEWIGAGTNIDAALPYLGGVPITENQAVAVNSGKVYFTGTDQKGNFQIGNELTINNNLGTISGRTFTKSLFAVITPYILAIGA